ncbi:hypothetical protein [Microbacterium aurantiacum]|uniref:hypothetical protein n=1 Tax=Microbacterium aurantiacum TaxID=162393 RepID=UPI0007DA92A8|nr:hypothetical protein [Microbacterium chocolatum]ANG86898.1 hypothetical protein A8L33_15115 [Microbacterium chocolatum]
MIAEDGPAAASEILHASDADDEVRAVTRQVLRALGEHDGPRLAVLYTSRSPYASLLHDRFAEAGIALNGPGVRRFAIVRRRTHSSPCSPSTRPMCVAARSSTGSARADPPERR